MTSLPKKLSLGDTPEHYGYAESLLWLSLSECAKQRPPISSRTSLLKLSSTLVVEGYLLR